jgi:hypothetical protein
MDVPPPNNGGNRRRFIPINPPLILHGSKKPANFKRAYTKLIGKTFDLKISHKKKILPNQIKILGITNSIFRKGSPLRNIFEVQNTVNAAIYFLSYYEISRYYLGRNYKKYSIKGNRISVAPFQISSNPKVLYSQLNTRKFDILGRIRRRQWEAEGLTEEQIKVKEQEIKDKPYVPDPNRQWDQPECVLYARDEEKDK